MGFQQPPYGQSPYGQQPQPYGQPPKPPVPSSAPAIIAALIVATILTVGLIAIAAVALGGSGDDDDSAPPITHSYTAEPTTEATTSEPARPSETETTAPIVGKGCDALLAKYKRERDSGELWQRIPDTAANRTALTAYLYLLTDLCMAAKFAPDRQSEYDAKAADLEQLFLAQKPLGTDIEIKLSDRTFRYNGTTGEGGFTPN